MLAQIPELSDLLMRAVVIIPALTFHEYAHAWAAYRAGDDTAFRMGRLTLNPLAHLDPIGTVMLFFGPIGWAKPVPVNPANLRRWPKDDILVSVAGVTVNAIQALIWTVVFGVLFWLQLKLAGRNSGQYSDTVWTLIEISVLGVLLNVALAIFNLIPIPPLDGSHVLGHMLKGEIAERYAQLRRFGPLLLIAFVIINYQTGILMNLIYAVAEPLLSLAKDVALRLS